MVPSKEEGGKERAVCDECIVGFGHRSVASLLGRGSG